MGASSGSSGSSASSVRLAEEIYRLVGRSRRLLWQAAAKRLEARDESIFRWQLLCSLVRGGPVSQRDLAYLTAQHPAGVSRLVDELESAGLVTRTPDPDDRRRQLVKATAKGRARFESVTPDAMAAVDEAMHALGREDRDALRKLLERLLDEAK